MKALKCLLSSLSISSNCFEGKIASALHEELQREYLGLILTQLREGRKPPNTVPSKDERQQRNMLSLAMPSCWGLVQLDHMGEPGRTRAACTYRIPTECCDLVPISTDSHGEEISLTTGGYIAC